MPHEDGESRLGEWLCWFGWHRWETMRETDFTKYQECQRCFKRSAHQPTERYGFHHIDWYWIRTGRWSPDGFEIDHGGNWHGETYADDFVFEPIVLDVAREDATILNRPIFVSW